MDLLENNIELTLHAFNIFRKYDILPGASPISSKDIYFSYIYKAIESFNKWCKDNYIHWEQKVYENHNCNRFYLKGGLDRKLRSAISGVFINFLRKEYPEINLPSHPGKYFLTVYVENKCLSGIEISSRYTHHSSYKILNDVISSMEVTSFIKQKALSGDLDSIILKLK